MPTGYFIEWAGEFKNMQEATQKLMILVPLSVFLVILLLYTAFNSLKKALLILLNVPFGLIGAILALVASGVYLSVSAIVGFIAIFAIAILNGIVLVSFINQVQRKISPCGFKNSSKRCNTLATQTCFNDSIYNTFWYFTFVVCYRSRK